MRASATRPPRRVSLSVRGRLLNTFAAFGAFVALILLALGLYLIDEQFANPIQSSDAGLILAAVLLTTSLATFSAVLRPARGQPRRRVELSNRLEESDAVRVSRLVNRIREEDEKLAGQAERYVDRSQVRLLIQPQARGIAGK